MSDGDARRNLEHSTIGRAAWLAALLLLVSGSLLRAQPLAFPGAEGFGRHAVGGRGGEMVHVTSLADSGPGTFREAVSKEGRTVVFDVGGVIRLKSPVSVSSHITLAGQTAPGEGITLYGNTVSFSNASDIVVRYLRFRMGMGGRRQKDTVGLHNGHTMIFDHVSVSWGRDENFSVTGTSHDITISDSIIAEGLQPHSCGGLVQADRVSILRTLYINNHTRNPKVKGRNQFANNVVTNWVVAAYIEGDSAGKSEATVLSNVFIAGPESKAAPFTRGNLNFNIHATGNVLDGDRDGTFNPQPIAQKEYGEVTWLEASPDHPPIRLLSPQEALERVIQQAGCSIKRDAVDLRLIAQLRDYGRQGKTIRSEAEAGGVGEVEGGTPPEDTDGDGLPDSWESAHGMSASEAGDGRADRNNDGYTNLEDYHNALAHSLPLTAMDPDRITYHLANGTEGWPKDIRERIVASMDAAVAHYNRHGAFRRNLTVNYNPGVPTAEANIDGLISFGKSISTRVALHEMGHTLGVGTHRRWGQNVKDGRWTGEHALARLREFDGPESVLHADRMHFWPYGLNYDRESSPDNDIRHVKMVAALAADMALPQRDRPPTPPLPEIALSDLAPLTAVAGWGGDPRMDKSIEDRPLRVGERAYRKGIGTHAPSEIVYALRPEHRRFVAVVGNDGEASGRGGSMIYEVLADGVPLTKTPLLEYEDFWHIDVQVPPRARQLTLRVTDGGDGNANDHGDWVNAGFLRR